MPLNLQIVTAERVVFEDEVDMVNVPGTDGYMGILPRHAPLLSTLKAGELKYRKGGQESYLAIGGGFIEVFKDKVVILADAAERTDEIDLERVEKARKQAEETLARRGDLSAEQAAAAEAALRFAMVRMDIGIRRRGGSSSRRNLGE